MARSANWILKYEWTFNWLRYLHGNNKLNRRSCVYKKTNAKMKNLHLSWKVILIVRKIAAKKNIIQSILLHFSYCTLVIWVSVVSLSYISNLHFWLNWAFHLFQLFLHFLYTQSDQCVTCTTVALIFRDYFLSSANMRYFFVLFRIWKKWTCTCSVHTTHITHINRIVYRQSSSIINVFFFFFF